MQKPVLILTALILTAASAMAGDRYDGRPAERYYAPPPAAPGARYYGAVNNYYGPVTIYAAPNGGYAAAYPAPDYPSYPQGYASAPECDATCYGVGYDWSHGYSYGYGYGAYGYPAYQNYGYPGVNGGAAMDPWAGYNWGPGNGYW